MSTHKRIDLICVIVLVCTLLLTVLFMNGEMLGLQRVVDQDAEQHSDSVYFTDADLDGDWDASSPTATITLNGSEAKVSGRGAYAYDGGVTITGAGTYVLSGELTDGSIVVDAHSSDKVRLLLNGAIVACSDAPALWVKQADKVFVTLAADTENALTDGAQYTQEALADGADGALFSHDDVTINGSGSLTVTGSYQHGVAANDDLVITGGDITVTAAGDGVRANDSLRFCAASLTVDAGDDGLVAANEEEGEGWLYIQSGTLVLTSADDAIHTAGDITIDGGAFTINAGDDGIHSDTAVTLNGGVIDIESCYEGVEAVTIDMTAGDVTIAPSDDGFNANGGSGGFGGMGGMGGMGGRGGFDRQQNTESGSESTAGEMNEDGSMPDFDGSTPEETDAAGAEASDTEETYIRISGGTLTIINPTGQDADGLDSNGSIYITGGDVRISLVNSGSNCAIDYGSESGGVCEITGGTVIACGSYSMAEGFDASSTQASILYNFSSGAQAGTALALEDESGNVLLSWEVPCSFSSANLSCPAMTVGGAYQVVIGDQAESITLEETSASFGDASSSMFGGMDRMGQGGGMQMRGGFGGRGSQTGESASSGSDADTPSQPAEGDVPQAPEGGFGEGEPPEMPEGSQSQGGFEGGMPQGGPGGMGGMGGPREIFSLLQTVEGVTLSQDGSLTVTEAGAQALLEALEESGREVTASAEDLTACTTLEELLSALGMSFGGRGGFGGDFGGRDRQSSQGSMPDGSGEGSRPEMPGEGSQPEFDGSMPEMPGEGSQPEFDGSMPEMPDGGSQPQGGTMTPPDQQTASSQQEEDAASTDTRTALWDLPQETWVWLGLSAGVLLVGLFIALVFRRRGRG